MNIIKEHFNSINEMLSVIESRTNNSVMSGKDSSHTGDKSFTGTKSYSEAHELFRNGYTEILPQIKAGVAGNLRKTEIRQRRRVETGVMGYAPHVPNAILGLPNSMIYTKAQPQKTKAVSLVVGITENCGTDASEFIKSGIAALGVVNSLELKGYRVNLKVAYWCAEAGNEKAFCTINVKDYREHLDLQKLCFPLAHPSMFRRFGFKWLETSPDIKDGSWNWGYGRQINSLDFVKENFLSENEYFINLKITRDNNYDPEAIIKYLNIEK